MPTAGGEELPGRKGDQLAVPSGKRDNSANSADGRHEVPSGERGAANCPLGSSNPPPPPPPLLLCFNA